ncbi:MAG: hypothetical protein ABIK93_05685 [candidate division WOR-3 bacterium]
MVKPKNFNRTVLFGLAMLATTLLLEVAYPQETKGVELRLISKQPIEKEQWSDVQEIKSKNGKFKGIVVYGEYTEFGPEVKKFALMDSKGNILWEKTHPIECGFQITNDGYVIAEKISPSSEYSFGLTSFSFYDQKGNLIRHTEKLRYSGKGDFLADVGYLLVRTEENDLLLFDTKGNLIQNYGPCKDFVASPDFKSLVVFYQKELRFYRNGEFIGKETIESHPLLGGMRISPDGEYLAYLTRNNISLFEIEKTKKLWQFDKVESLSFASLDLSFYGEIVAVGLDYNVKNDPKTHSYGYVYLFNREGNKLAEQKIGYTEWNIWTPNVDITEDGKFLYIKTLNEIYKFEVK